MPAFTIRRLQPGDAADYRLLRLAGLHAHPAAFGASWQEESARPLDWFAERLTQNMVFGGWRDESGLMGMAALAVPATAKLKHKGTLWGVYVRPEARGTGLATSLLARVIDSAAGELEQVHLTVDTANHAAYRLYTRAGFQTYGEERRALKIDDRYVDTFLMARPLPAQ